MKGKILLVVAEMQEAKHLIEHYRMQKKRYVSIDLWSGNDFNLIVTGPGVNNVISTLSIAMCLKVFTIESTVINVGYAGAKGLNVGQVVCVKNSHCLEFPVRADTKVKNCIKLSDKGYDCYTSFDFVERADNIENALFDMELAYIARFPCFKLHSIKIVSDNLDYDTFQDFDGDEAWKKAIKMIEERRK